MLDDGDYEAMVVDATEAGDALELDVTVLTGAHKGEVITITARGLGRDALDLFAVPATLHVRDGEPSIVLEG